MSNEPPCQPLRQTDDKVVQLESTLTSQGKTLAEHTHMLRAGADRMTALQETTAETQRLVLDNTDKQRVGFDELRDQLAGMITVEQGVRKTGQLMKWAVIGANRIAKFLTPIILVGCILAAFLYGLIGAEVPRWLLRVMQMGAK